jgi:glycosyltransferase involved in cell wall biosynthesis
MTPADLTAVVANYNHARHLPRALDAILAQSVRPREVIVIDDASDRDDSWAVIEDYTRRDPVVRPVRHARNRGVCASYNAGLAAAQGRYVVLAGADDNVLPGFFEAAVTQLDRHPEAGLCCGYDSFRRGPDGPVEPAPTGWCTEPTYFSADDVQRLVRRNLAAHATIARTDALRAAGGYLPDLAWYADWFAYLVIAFRHGMVHVPAPLAVRTLDMPGAYSTGAGVDERNVAALNGLLTRLASSEYADVAPRFRGGGSPASLGADLVRAAARRADRWSLPVLGLLNGFSRAEYRRLLDDPDPSVRELAELFLGPFWRVAEREQADRQAELVHLKNLLRLAEAKAPPPGLGGKLRWIAGRAARRLRPAG